MTTRPWNTGGIEIGTVVRIRKCDFSRVGHSWMRGRLLEGDLAIAVALTGDAFWTWRLLHYSVDGRGVPMARVIPHSDFGAYTMGERIGLPLTDGFALLANQPVAHAAFGPRVEAAPEPGWLAPQALALILRRAREEGPGWAKVWHELLGAYVGNARLLMSGDACDVPKGAEARALQAIVAWGEKEGF